MTELLKKKVGPVDPAESASASEMNQGPIQADSKVRAAMLVRFTEECNKVSPDQKKLIAQSWNLVYEKQKSKFLALFKESISRDDDIDEEYRAYIERAFERVNPQLILEGYSQVVGYVSNNRITECFELLNRIGVVHHTQEVDLKELHYIRGHMAKVLKSALGGGFSNSLRLAYQQLSIIVQVGIMSAYKERAASEIKIPSQEEFGTVRNQWKVIMNSKEDVMESLYFNLHEEHDVMKEFFPTIAKLVSLFAGFTRLVGMTHDTDMLMTYMMQLGKMHVDLAVGRRHFKMLTRAWFKTISKFLGVQYDDESRSAWANVWSFLVHLLKQSILEAEMTHVSRDAEQIKLCVTIHHLDQIDPTKLTFFSNLEFYACTNGNPTTVAQVFEDAMENARKLKKTAKQIITESMCMDGDNGMKGGQNSADGMKSNGMNGSGGAIVAGQPVWRVSFANAMDINDLLSHLNHDSSNKVSASDSTGSSSSSAMNSNEMTVVSDSTRGHFISKKGEWYQRGHVSGTFSQKFDLKSYPFDLHVLRIKLHLDCQSKVAKWSQENPSQDVIVRYSSSNRITIGGTEWYVYMPSIRVRKVSYDGGNNKSSECVIEIPVYRRFHFILLHAVMPLFIIDFFAMMVYAVKVSFIFEKMQLFATLFLLVFAFHHTVMDQLLPHPCHTTMITNQFYMTLVFLLAHSVIATVEYLIHHKIDKNLEHSIDTILLVIAFFGVITNKIVFGYKAWTKLKENEMLLADFHDGDFNGGDFINPGGNSTSALMSSTGRDGMQSTTMSHGASSMGGDSSEA